jgi:hypothetical protein
MLTSLSFLEPGQPWPPASEKERIALYHENKELREGDFNEVWPELNKYMRDDKPQALDFFLGYPWLVTKKTIDLICGEPCTFMLPKGQDASQGTLDYFIKAINYRQVLREQIGDIDALGDSVQKITKDAAGNVRISSISPSCWYPVVKEGTRDVVYHVLAFLLSRGEQCILEAEIHSLKEVEHRAYVLNQAVAGGLSSTIGNKLPWEEYAPGVKEIEPNPTGQFLVVVANNQRMTGDICGRSSYGSDFKSILKRLIIRYASANNVLDVFSKPTIFGSKDLTDTDPITKKPVFRPGGYIGIQCDPGVTPVAPAALTWDAHLPEVDAATKSLLERLFDVSEMSPVLFSSNALAGTAESGTALRLRLINTMSKVARVREEIDVAAIVALQTAGKLAGVPLEGLYIEWQDGLPSIPLEEAQYYTLMFPILGQKETLRLMDYSDEEIADIMGDTVGEVMQPGETVL